MSGTKRPGIMSGSAARADTVATRSVFRVSLALLAGALLLPFGFAAYQLARYYRVYKIALEPAAEDNGPRYSLAYFPVMATGGGITSATSYAEHFSGYNRLRTDYVTPRALPGQWTFRRERAALRYGFVVRRWLPPPRPKRRGGKLDNSDLRVHWVTTDELDSAIERGRLDFPRFADLPPFDRELAVRIVQVGDDLVP